MNSARRFVNIITIQMLFCKKYVIYFTAQEMFSHLIKVLYLAYILLYIFRISCGGK